MLDATTTGEPNPDVGMCVALVLWLVFYRVFRAWAEARTRMSEASPTSLPRSIQR